VDCQAAGFVLLTNEKFMNFKKTNLWVYKEIKINGMFKGFFLFISSFRLPFPALYSDDLRN